MKKLLFILVAILSLCACCSSDDDSRSANVTNQFIYDGKSYKIDSAYINHYVLILYSGKYHRLTFNTSHIQKGIKNFLSDISEEVILYEFDKDGNEGYLHFWGIHGSIIDKSSYLTIKNNDEDNRTSIEAYVNDGVKNIKVNYLGVPRVE